MFETPILFIIYNRPDRTQLVFNEIKKQKPIKLYVHADGPRSGNQNDIFKCRESQKIIDEQVDWSCELHKLYRTDNLGCGRGPAEAITWFFTEVEEGIIIEDDCLPHPDFFNYCEELLIRYRFSEKIMVIGAATYRDDYPCKYSYTFTIYATMAAWATWRRVWSLYDHHLSFTNRNELQLKLKSLFYSEFECEHWMKLYDWIVEDGFSDYWDWQLSFLLFYHHGLAIRPQKNLISNIGTGEDATHTKNVSSEMFAAYRETFSILPLMHPPQINSDMKVDSIYFKKMYYEPFSIRIKDFLRKHLIKFKILTLKN
jgi:hypothetical protein